MAVPRQLVLAAFLAASCATTTTSTSPTPGSTNSAGPTASYGAECAAFRPDPSAPFYPPTNASYNDPTLIDWPTASPADVDLDEALLNAAAENAALSPEIASLLVIRHGKLIFERYFNGSNAAEANNVHSVSKSILSLVVGIAVEEDLLDLDSMIGDYLPPDLVGEHGDLTVDNLLTMSGGLRVDRMHEGDYEWKPSDKPGEPSFVRAVLERPSVAAEGSEFEYNTGLTQVLAAVVTEATGQSLCAYAADRLLGPLGVDVEKWWVETGGYFAGGDSFYISPREMARFGQLVLQGGQWDGRQLVPQSWLNLTLAERWDLGCFTGRSVHKGYGYLWWPMDVDGHLVWQASGGGGQGLWIVPDMDLLLVITHHSSNVGDPPRREVNDVSVARVALFSQAPAPAAPPKCPQSKLKGYTIRPDCTERTAIAHWPLNGLPWSWSRDGSSIAVQLDGRDLNSEIYMVAADGTIATRLTRDLAFDGLPAWSPDGSRVAFTRGEPATTDLYVVRRDGSALTQLTDLDGFANSPTWSADGARIAFVRGDRETKVVGESGELWVIDADGSDPTPLLERSLGYPSWSPDGRQIALELRGEETHIGILDLETGALTDLGKGFAPKWSPDGSRLAFVGQTDGVSDIYVINADGTNIVQLTDDAAFDTFPIWSLDGQLILYLSAAGGS